MLNRSPIDRLQDSIPTVRLVFKHTPEELHAHGLRTGEGIANRSTRNTAIVSESWLAAISHSPAPSSAKPLGVRPRVLWWPVQVSVPSDRSIANIAIESCPRLEA